MRVGVLRADHQAVDRGGVEARRAPEILERGHAHLRGFLPRVALGQRLEPDLVADEALVLAGLPAPRVVGNRVRRDEAADRLDPDHRHSPKKTWPTGWPAWERSPW